MRSKWQPQFIVWDTKTSIIKSKIIFKLFHTKIIPELYLLLSFQSSIFFTFFRRKTYTFAYLWKHDVNGVIFMLNFCHTHNKKKLEWYQKLQFQCSKVFPLLLYFLNFWAEFFFVKLFWDWNYTFFLIHHLSFNSFITHLWHLLIFNYCMLTKIS